MTLYTRGFSHFVTSMTAPIAAGRSGSCRVGLAPTGKAPPYHGAHPKPTFGRYGLRASPAEMSANILDNYEERWAVSESPSERQIAWLETQLDGTWRAVGSKSMLDATGVDPGTGNDVGATAVPVSDIIQFPTMERDLERRIDAMISRKLAGPGKTVVDLRRLDELEEAIDGLKRAVRAMR